MQNNVNNHSSDKRALILSQHQLAWLLVGVVAVMAVTFGAGYYVGQSSVNQLSKDQMQAASMVNQIASSCNGWENNTNLHVNCIGTKE